MTAQRIECDVAVVGAGPAGLAAASVCARAGADAILLDENGDLGGQIYRGITIAEPRRRDMFGADYLQGERLVDEFRASGARHEPYATAWSISPELEVAVSRDGESRLVSAKSVILATGALERPFPIPGWTLPGVMTAGAAQSLLKSAALVPAGRTVLAGTGPLLFVAAQQLLAAGASIAAILETTPHENRLRALPHLPGFLVSPYARRAAKLVFAVRGHVALVPGVTELRASGGGKLEGISYRTGDGGGRTLPADTLLLHQGVVPETQLAMAAGVEHRWDSLRLCWVPVVDPNGGTNVPGLLIAGDAAGIAGAQAAAWRGLLAGIAVMQSLHPGRKIHHAQLARTAISQFTRGRRFFETLYKPAPRFRVPSDETLACRCEEVTAGEIRAAVDDGCVGPNQAKAYTRCGMGPCQGRLCGLTVTEIIAQRRGVSPAQVGHFTARFPSSPVTLAEIASLPQGQSAIDAVVR
jgi:NADPH-dependent 2,4-dienoyl-CoA reductase/sulfur reductase-like enzyme